MQSRGLFGQLSQPATQSFGVPRPWFLRPLFIALSGSWLAVLVVLIVYFTAHRKHQFRLAEQRQRKLEHQLRHAQKMEAVGQLAAGIGHDFNNLLTAILGYTEWARDSTTNALNVTEALDGIDRVVHQAAGLTRALNSFVRKPTGELRVLDLSGTVTAAVAMLKRMFPASIDISLRTTPPGTVFVKGDDSQLQQLLVNLAVNARDAMPEGGHLAISLTRDKSATGHDCARLTIADSGTGIEPDVRERVFEPFFTTKPRERGTGLGLAIVHGIVTSHAGDIAVDSQVGRGTSVCITLPCCAESTEPVTVLPPAHHVAGTGHRVLVVEDNNEIRTLIVGALSTYGYDTLSAADGNSGLALYTRNAERLDAVIMDIDLPGRSGEECIEHIRATSSTLPIVVITGSVEFQLPHAQHDFTVLLRKPFPPHEVGPLIQRMIQQSTAIPRPR